MFNIQKLANKNLFNLCIIIFLISSCSSMNVTEETVYAAGYSSKEEYLDAIHDWLNGQ